MEDRTVLRRSARKENEEVESFCGLRLTFWSGEEKGEDIGKRSFLSSIYDDINQKYDLSPDTWILFQLIFRIVLFVAGVFLIPAFIQESELFLIVLYIYAIFGIIKEIERRENMDGDQLFLI